MGKKTQLQLRKPKELLVCKQNDGTAMKRLKNKNPNNKITTTVETCE